MLYHPPSCELRKDSREVVSSFKTEVYPKIISDFTPYLMEVAPKSISPHLQRVLKSYQTTANRSLQGPGTDGLVLMSTTEMAKISSDDYRKALVSKLFSSEKVECDSHGRAPPPFPVQQMPVFTPVDTERGEKMETYLEGENIACFLVGGEKRLCLPQILTTVLRDFSLPQINKVCEDLQIFCSRCNHEQLEILKVTGILPLSAPSCGLITKTDAERLCNALLHCSPENAHHRSTNINTFKVYHECFGKCKGVFDPEAYSSPRAICIQCVDCGGWFGPQKFVCHSHSMENHTCHWGFDSANWRSYLLLAKDQGGKEKLQDALEQMKMRFDSTNKYKRKQTMDTESEHSKRCKSETPSDPVSAWSEQNSTLRAMMSAFQPWSPGMPGMRKDVKLLPAAPAIMREGFAGMVAPSYLHTGPPVLLHPDKVVPHSESSRYEPNYAPNVSLAPAPLQKGKIEDERDEVEEEIIIKKRPLSPEPGPSKVFKEWDLMSESDDSSVERFSMSEGDDSRFGSPSLHRTLEIEIGMLRQALEGKAEIENKEQFLQEFCRLRARHEELLNQSLQARRHMKQELAQEKACTKEQLKEASDKTHSMEKEVKELRRQSMSRIHEAEEDKEKLIKDVKAIKERDDLEFKGLLQINQAITTRLQHCEIAYETLQHENRIMQEKLLQMGINVRDLVTKQTMNGALRSPSGSPPQRSPSEAGLSPRHRMLLGPHTLHGKSLEAGSMKAEQDT